MKVGDVVTITAKYPYNTNVNCEGETGVITEHDVENNVFEITTGNPYTTEYWYEETEFRLATEEEIKDRLRYLLMD